MASPLNVFRKYQAQVMVALLFVAMFTFVVAPPIASFLSTGGIKSASADKVAVTWKGGKLTEVSLYNLRQDHNQLLNFLDAVQRKAQESGGRPKVSPIYRARGEEELVQRVIKAQKAEQLGIVISEEAMTVFLEALSDNSLRGPQLKRVMNEATNERLDERTMFRQLRTELLAQKMETLAVGDLDQEFNRAALNEQPYALPPAVAWDYFGRIHRRVRAEMYPVKAADFISQVKDQPTEGQIQTLYEEYKNTYPNPFSAEPGFKRYNQVAFQYVKADLKKFTAEAKAAVTEEQIKEYYEKNKDTSYVEVDLPELPEDKTEDKKPDDKKTDEGKPEEKKPEEKKPEDGKPDDKKPEGKKPEDSKPEEKKPEEKKADDPDKPAKPEGCDDEAEKEKAAAKKDDPATPEETKVDEAKKGEPKKDETKKDDAKKDDPEKPAEPKTETPEKKPAVDEGKTGEEPAKPKKKEVKYKPLNDKLKEDIRGLIAGPIANERFGKSVKEVQDKIRDYGRELRTWEAVTKSDPKNKDPKPEEVDVKKLARSLGMTSDAVPLIDLMEMYEDGKREKPKYELSQAQQFDQRRGGMVEFALSAFDSGAPLYEAHLARGANKGAGDEEIYFVFWRTEEKPAYVPPLKEARENVVAVWQQREAFKLAQAAADKLAKSVGSSGKSILESLPAADADKAFETDSFSWLSRNTPRGAPGQYGITRIKKLGGGFDEDAVDTAGAEFMEGVFGLKKGECGVAVNEPHTVVYVVRIIEEPIPEELLLQMFLDAPSKLDIYMLAANDRVRQLGGWQKEIEKEMAIKWHRDPWTSERM